MKHCTNIIVFLLFSFSCFSQAKSFRWVAWKDVAAKEKADLQKIKAFKSVMDDMKSGCDVKVAVVDLDNNGVNGYAISEEGGACCGGAGCTFIVLEDSGKKTIYLTDQLDAVKPAKNGVTSSTGKFIPLK